MSRIGKLPISVPDGIKVEINGSQVKVTGPKGTLERTFHPRVTIELKDGQILVKRKSDEKFDRSLHGLTRSLLQNMVTGVNTGFNKQLEINGVGYSHPVEKAFPEGVTCTVENNIITVSGIDKEAVGQFAALIRGIRKPEPYKGKGIRYIDEYVARKEGKKAAATT